MSTLVKFLKRQTQNSARKRVANVVGSNGSNVKLWKQWQQWKFVGFVHQIQGRASREMVTNCKRQPIFCAPSTSVCTRAGGPVKK